MNSFLGYEGAQAIAEALPVCSAILAPSGSIGFSPLLLIRPPSRRS